MDISDFIGAAKTFHVLGIKVTKDGDLINEWYSEPECRRNIYSATKSFTSCAVGFAVQEGLLSLDEKLTDAFPEDLPDVIDDNLKMATVRDLLTMCLGQEQGSLMGEQRPLYQEDDWVKMSLAIPFQYKPGTHFVVSLPCCLSEIFINLCVFPPHQPLLINTFHLTIKPNMKMHSA